jgi:hypothetical protein
LLIFRRSGSGSINQSHELVGAYKLACPTFEVVHGGVHGGKLFFT